MSGSEVTGGGPLSVVARSLDDMRRYLRVGTAHLRQPSVRERLRGAILQVVARRSACEGWRTSRFARFGVPKHRAANPWSPGVESLSGTERGAAVNSAGPRGLLTRERESSNPKSRAPARNSYGIGRFASKRERRPKTPGGVTSRRCLVTRGELGVRSRSLGSPSRTLFELETPGCG